MSSVSSSQRLSVAERERAVAEAVASVRLEGLDPSAAAVHLDAWVAGEIDVDEMVARGIADATAQAQQESPAAA